ncbi:MAG: hypothetical protein C0623_12200 [Desulfuromonas sp.]|nr:MAG: hypothetical protein C0623_12200 [Desulfuromonas sp.]
MTRGSRTVERTCVTCRKKGEQDQFIRYVAGPEQKVYVDYRDRLPGRGAYTCADRRCVENAVRSNAFDRAFRHKTAEVDPDGILTTIREAINQRILGLLGIARKAGAVASGRSALQSFLERNEIRCLVIANDASDRSLNELKASAEVTDCAMARFSSQEELGKILGRDNRNCVGIKDKHFAELIALEISRFQKIAGEN